MKRQVRMSWGILIILWLLMAGCSTSLDMAPTAKSAPQKPAQTKPTQKPVQKEEMAANAQLVLKEVNLVSNVKGIAATTDDKLVDSWGLEFGHTGRIWLNNNTGYSTVYDGDGKIVMVDDGKGKQIPLAVKIPTPPGATDPAPLTGMAFSEKNAFKGDSFIFATEQGTIAGWDKPMIVQAMMRVDNSAKGAVYKGLATAGTPKGDWLYATNFAQGTIDVFDHNYEPVTTAGKFVDPTLPKNYAPFGIKSIKDSLYVTFVELASDKANDVGGVGHGYIDIFDTNGQFKKRLVSNGPLNSPWGLALAPKDFGAFSDKLLVGNFRDGYIHVFDPDSGQLIGQVMDKTGAPLQIDMLWSLTFGNDNKAGSHNQLYFAAGSSSETAGLFGRLDLGK